MKKGERLMKIIGDADDKFVDEAAQKQKKRGFKMWVAGGGLCAAALVGVIALNGVFGSPGEVSGVISGITSEAQSETADTPSAPGTAETEQADITLPEPFEPFDEDNPYDTDARRASNGLISEITATDTSGGFIKANTSFLIKSTRDVETDELKERLKLPEGKEFELTKLSECEYKLSPREILEEGEIVKLGALGKYGDVIDSWAFQTTEAFKVKSCYPADGSHDVYNDTGIEIEFTAPPSTADIEDYIEIDPPVDVQFSLHRKTLCLIPPYIGLKSDAAYTVTLKKGLKGLYNGELTEDYSFSFRTSQRERGSYIFTYNGYNETFIQGDPVVIEIQMSKELRDKDVELELYRYNSSDGYYEDIRAYAENTADKPDIDGLELVYSNTDKAIPNTEDNLPLFLVLPDDLEEGWYLADINCAGRNCRYMLEINPISVYSLALDNENVFFVNDASTGKAAEGAEITLLLDGKTYTGTADKDGLCNIKTDGGEGKYGVVDIKYNGSRYIDVYTSAGNYEIIYDDLYYMYLYTDREAYLPSDTINVWGAVIPRRDGAVVPSEMYIGFGESETEGERVKVTLDADGTFCASFTYKDHTTDYSRITLYDGTNDMCEMHSKFLRITEYVKPTYVITPEVPDYVVMPQRDAVTVGVDASFYEGTPAKGLELEASCGNCVREIVTDSNGRASAQLLDDDREYWRPGPMAVVFTTSGVQAEYSSTRRYIPAFYRDVMCNAEYDNDAHSLSVELNSIDFSKAGEFLQRKNYPYDYSILKGAPYDTKITVVVNRSWSEKIVVGSYYDYIEKHTVTNYDFIHKEEVFGTYTVNTENGKALLDDLVFDKEGNYSIKITYEDSRGGLTEENLYNVKYDYTMYSDVNRVYYGFEYNDISTSFFNIYDFDNMMYYTFDENTDMRFELKALNAEPSDNGRIFFAGHQNDFFDLAVYEGNEFVYDPPLSALPSFKVSGAYFDGRHIYPISRMGFRFDPSERKAALTITPDKSRYDAGDEVSITVNAKDTNGDPLPGTSVILSLVDEAAFAIMDQKVTLLDDMYATIYYPYASYGCSYIQHVYGDNPYGGAKGGGEGDLNARRDFKDNAFFDRAVTDENGTARFSFKLPDNLTTWRATALAVKETETGRLYAGNGTCPVVATRPLFITPIMLKEYVEGDDIAFSAKCVGLDEGGTVTCTVKGRDTDMTLTAEPGKTVNFGKLPLGEYKALFTAQNGGSSDAVEMPFSVVDSVLEAPAKNSFDLSEGVDISPKKYPVRMAFYDKEYMFCTEVLKKLSDYYGARLDMKVAAAYADIKLGYSDDMTLSEQFAGEMSGGFAQLMRDSEYDAVLTAKLAAALPEVISRSAAVGSCEDMLGEELFASDKSACYLILAALGEPVLEELKTVLDKNEGEFDWFDKMRLVTALALCGDYNTAYAHYLELVPEIEHEVRGETAYAHIEAGEDSQEMTAAALMAASVLKLKEADMFARWLAGETPKYDSFALELVTYLENYVPKTDGDAVFTFNLNGELKTVKLDKHHPTIMSFGEKQLKNAAFKVTSGEVFTEVSYIGKPDAQDTEPTVIVRKTVTGGQKPGDRAYVNITVDSSVDGYFRIDDVIPSCGRYSPSEYDSQCDVNGQKVTLYINPRYENNVRYNFRVATEGDYVLESAVAQGENGWGMSERTTIAVPEQD